VRVEDLERSQADAVVLTPSHQWPTGGVLSADARARVIRWAHARGAVVIEDDYDAEYRYDRSPVGAMQGLDPDHVVYCGTASKTLAPGLRLGWMLVPPHLVDAVAQAKVLADRGSPVIDQLTFADFLNRGEFDRHLRRMRPVYRARATRCWPRWPPACPTSNRPGWRPASTSSPGCRRTSTRPPSWRRPRGTGSRCRESPSTGCGPAAVAG
jgi:DNA-binding transcriptional MocR family regulator